MNADHIDAILADFRAWLLEAHAMPADIEPVESLDVATVLQHFIALRQEVNLQTKATRSQQEQGSQALALMQQTFEAMQRREQQAREQEKNAQEELVRPLLKTLIETHDALWLAEREVARMRENPPGFPLPAALSPPADVPPKIKLKIPHWARWIGLDASVEAQLAPLHAWCAARAGMPMPTPEPVINEAAERLEPILDALLVGYRMSLQRLERAMRQQELEAIECLGESFDPETMEVAEVVREEGRDGTEVIEEVRRGYRWRGRVFRCAQVRVARA